MGRKARTTFRVQHVTRQLLWYKDKAGNMQLLACSGDISTPRAIALAAAEYGVAMESICRIEVVTEIRRISRQIKHNH